MSVPKVTIPVQASTAQRESHTGWHDDSDLIVRCKQGDQMAWKLLVERYSRLVFSIPKRAGLDESSCDDVFQVVFASLLRELPRLRDHRSLPKWLMTAAFRTAWKTLRERNSRDRLRQSAGEDDPSVPPADQLIAWERQHLVRLALHRLGDRCQTLLEALYLNSTEPSYEMVSRRLEIPIGSIGPTRARCLAKLSEICAEMGFE